jgi:SAM-dependent methyltransferase
MNTIEYAAPRHVTDLDQCKWYHSMDLPGHGPVVGAWDLRGRFDEYVGHVDLQEKRVLDVGAASGFLTVEAEKRGAHVVSFDADDVGRMKLMPYKAQPNAEDLAPSKEAFEWMRNSYWLAHRAFGLKAQAYYGDLHNLPDALGMFDIAIIGQILVHQRDPLGAIASVAARTRRLVIVEGMVNIADVPFALFLNSPERRESWWHLSVALYDRMLQGVGFRRVGFSEAKYRCVWANEDVVIATLIADRVD